MSPRWPGALAALMAAVLGLALLLPGLGAVPFDDPGEGQHAEIAREVLITGDLLTLRLNGIRYFDKPPLLYWLGALSFSLFGVEEWSARLVPVLGAVLALAATAVLGARLLGWTGGMLAAVALLTSPLFMAFARYLRPETLFVAAIQWGLTGLLLGGRAQPPAGRRWTLLGCASLGLAALAKDPLGLLGPLLAVGLARALAGRWRPLRSWLPGAGLALVVLLGVGWYAAAAAANRGFLWYSVVDNHVLNVLRLRRFPDEDVPLSLLEFLAVMGAGAFPWLIGATVTVASLLRRRAWRDPAETPWVALMLWALGALALVALSPFRLPQYALPAFPAVALLAARAWWEREQRPRRLAAVHAVLFAALAGVCWLAAESDGRAFVNAVFGVTDAYTRKEAAVAQSPPFPPWSALAPLVGITAVCLTLATLWLLGALLRRSSRSGAFGMAVAMTFTMLPVLRGEALVSSARSVAGMADEVRRQLRPGDRLIHEGPIENSGALEFYSGRRPILLDATRSVLGFGATFPEARETFWEAERLRREWTGSGRLILVTPRAPEKSLVAFLPPERVRLLRAEGGRWLYDNGLPGR